MNGRQAVSEDKQLLLAKTVRDAQPHGLGQGQGVKQWWFWVLAPGSQHHYMYLNLHRRSQFSLAMDPRSQPVEAAGSSEDWDTASRNSHWLGTAIRGHQELWLPIRAEVQVDIVLLVHLGLTLANHIRLIGWYLPILVCGLKPLTARNWKWWTREG